jgi:sarcosine oxidase gamma subunit
VRRRVGVAGTRVLRLAPDEVMVLGAPDAIAAILRTVADAVAIVDPDAVVIDASDGWSTWTLNGDAIEAAVSRLSSLELPREGFVQGDLARVPVKMVASDGRVDVLVPAMWREYLRDAIFRRCRPLGIAEGAR